MSSQDYINLLMDRKRYLLKHVDYVKKVIPDSLEVSQLIEDTDRELDLLSKLPDVAFTSIEFQPLDDIKKFNGEIEKRYPIPPIPTDYFGGTIAISSASSVSIFTKVSSTDIDLHTWLSDEIEAYEVSLSRHNKIKEVGRRLALIKSNIAEEYTTSEQAYLSTKQGLGLRSTAGITMRNVLEHTKGELFGRVQKKKGRVTWQEMTSKLSISIEGSLEYRTLLNLEYDWDSLHQDLTNLAKNLPLSVNVTLDVLWIRYIELLYSLSGLINLGEQPQE